MQTFIIYFLLIVALVLICAVCKRKGLFSVLSLLATMLILLNISIPLIIKGYHPMAVMFASAIAIIFFIIYLTEGWRPSSHITILAIIISFTVTSLLAYATINLMGISGLISEETAYVVQYGVLTKYLPELLVSGIMIGTLGVLTEMVTTQVALVEELAKTSATQHRDTIFKKAYQLGVTHLTSMVNTLFLIYAGVSLPILIIIIAGHASLANILHSQLLVSDIVSTLTGVIGLIMSMPIATALAVFWLKKNKYHDHQG